MRRNPRPYRSIDRRALAIEIIEREVRMMASRGAMEGAFGRGRPEVLTLNKPQSPVLARLIEEKRNEDPRSSPRVRSRSQTTQPLVTAKGRGPPVGYSG